MGPTGSGPLLNFTSGARTARSTYLINEPAIIQVPGRNVSFGNRSGPPIVDQLSVRDGSGADVKVNSERHDRDPARTGEWLRMLNSAARPQADAGFGSRAQRSQAGPGVGFFPRSWSLR